MAHVPLDWLGAVLTFLGLAGPVLALIRQPVVGWGSSEVWGPGIAGVVLLGIFLVHEQRTPAPMLPLGLFTRRNFAIGNLQTFAMYGGLSVTFFFLVLFLQQVAGYDALQAGLALMPATLVMFALSKRAGRLADRFGPRLFMGFGPLTAALGLALDAAHRRAPELRHRPPAGAADLLARAVRHGRAAHGDRARRRRRVQRRHRLGHQQRHRARRGPARRRRASAPSSRRSSSSALDDRLAGQTLSPPARAAVEQARKETLARVDPAHGRRGGRSRRAIRVGPRLPRRHRHLDDARWRSAACSAWPASATRAAPCAARTARAASSPASRSTRRASARRSSSSSAPESARLAKRGLPPATQRSRSSTCSGGQAPSQGMLPVLTAPRIASACRLTSSCDQRSKAKRIDVWSRSRKSGLTCSLEAHGLDRARAVPQVGPPARCRTRAYA